MPGFLIIVLVFLFVVFVVQFAEGIVVLICAKIYLRKKYAELQNMTDETKGIAEAYLKLSRPVRYAKSFLGGTVCYFIGLAVMSAIFISGNFPEISEGKAESFLMCLLFFGPVFSWVALIINCFAINSLIKLKYLQTLTSSVHSAAWGIWILPVFTMLIGGLNALLTLFVSKSILEKVFNF